MARAATEIPKNVGSGAVHLFKQMANFYVPSLTAMGFGAPDIINEKIQKEYLGEKI